MNPRLENWLRIKSAIANPPGSGPAWYLEGLKGLAAGVEYGEKTIAAVRKKKTCSVRSLERELSCDYITAVMMLEWLVEMEVVDKNGTVLPPKIVQTPLL